MKQEIYSNIERAMTSPLSRALLASLSKHKFVCDIDFFELSRCNLSDGLLVEFADKLYWGEILFRQSLSLKVVRACHHHFMTQALFTAVEHRLPNEVEKLRWALIFNFEYKIKVDYAKLSRENIPNMFIDMFAPALDWACVLRYSSVDSSLLLKYKTYWQGETM
jgi:hypothetical protein